jgi:hypothetical protein
VPKGYIYIYMCVCVWNKFLPILHFEDAHYLACVFIQQNVQRCFLYETACGREVKLEKHQDHIQRKQNTSHDVLTKYTKSFSNKPTILSTDFILCFLFSIRRPRLITTWHLFSSKKTTEEELTLMYLRQNILLASARRSCVWDFSSLLHSSGPQHVILWGWLFLQL